MTSNPATITSAVLLALVLASPMTAEAQMDSNKAAAEALFQQGRQLLEQKDYAAACAKLAASQKLETAIGTLLFLGECNERLGKNATAWAAFREAQSLAGRAGDGEREKVAAVRAAALEPVVSRMVLRVTRPTAGMTIRHDGVELPRASWDSPLPVDAGEHRLEAAAPDKAPWVKVVTVANGGAVLAVDVPELVDAPVSSSPPPADPSEPAEPRSPVSTESTNAGMGGMAITGLVTIGIGAVGLGIGSAFGAMAKSSNDESLDHCRTPTLCSPTGLELRDDAQSEATLSTGFFVAGGALAVAGVTLFLLAPSDDGSTEPEGASAERSAAPVALTVAAGPGQSGFLLRGQW
ncbi:MAG: hypothetical protein JRI68_31780 [Deltaproteobacteria bacterium]|nr:hypothetical protein [Deltaproteobacteria bacterium]